MLLQLSRGAQGLTKEAILAPVVSFGLRQAGKAGLGAARLGGKAIAAGVKNPTLGLAGLTAGATAHGVGSSMLKAKKQVGQVAQAMKYGPRPAPHQQIFR